MATNRFRNLPGHSRRRAVAEATIRVSPTTGHVSLTGKVWYIPRTKTVRVYILGKKTRGNLGPPIDREEITSWGDSRDAESMRKHMEARLRRAAADLLAHTWPTSGMQITKCNTTGMTVTEYMEQTCVNCTCWYCELSDAR